VKALSRWLYSIWYENGSGGWLLWPLEAFFRVVAALRRALFSIGVLRAGKVDVPVVVVGNIAVGGGGKTPLVGWIATQLAAKGVKAAIVSRGYGGAEPRQPLTVTRDTPAHIAGDEALMLARATDALVIVCRDRLAAARAAADAGAQVIVSDDGLQHYALGRDLEIVVIDAERQHGNAHCLPAGPLREPVSRLDSVDLIVMAGNAPCPPGGLSYRLSLESARNALGSAVVALDHFTGQSVYALAGIAHPKRFFTALEERGIRVTPIAAADHERVGASDLNPDDSLPFLMTEKDAVKYSELGERHWIVPVSVVMSDKDCAALLDKIVALLDS